MQMCAPSITAALLSSRHIHRSSAHPPGAHPEAVWVSERGVGACCGCCCCCCCSSCWRMTFFTPRRLGTTLRYFYYFPLLTNTASRKYTSASVSACKPRRSTISILFFCFFFIFLCEGLHGKTFAKLKGLCSIASSRCIILVLDHHKKILGSSTFLFSPAC